MWYNKEMHIDIAHLIIVLVVILISMTLHEAMHGFVAYWLGDDTAKEQGRLTLNPLHHIDPFLTILLPLSLALLGLPVFGGAKPVPYNPERVRGDEWGAALVGLAGRHPAGNRIRALLPAVCVVWHQYLPAQIQRRVSASAMRGGDCFANHALTVAAYNAPHRKNVPTGTLLDLTEQTHEKNADLYCPGRRFHSRHRPGACR